MEWFWVFLIYVWVKKCVSMFKMLKRLLEMPYQTSPNFSKVEFQRCLKEKEKIRRVGLNPSPAWKPKIYESKTWTWLEIPTNLPKALQVRLGLVGFRVGGGSMPSPKDDKVSLVGGL